MTLPFQVGLALALAGAVSGCGLEFVDVDVDQAESAHFVADVSASSESDSIWIRAELRTGVDEAGRSRRVLSDFQADGRSLVPDLSTEQERSWIIFLPRTTAAEGSLLLTPPRLEGLATPRQLIIPIASLTGPREKIVTTGQPIELPFAFAPIPRLAGWEVYLSDAEERILYTAQSQRFPSGPVLIQEDVLPAIGAGPYEVRILVRAHVLDEPDQGRYHVSIRTLGDLLWMVRRE